MRSLRSQLSLSIMLIMLVAVALVSLLVNITVNRQFEGYITAQEQTRRDNIVSDLSNQYNRTTRNWNTEYLHAIGMYSLYDGYLLTVNNPAGRMLWDAESHDMTLCREIMNDISARMNQRKSNGGFTTYTYDLLQGKEKIGSVSIRAYGPYFFKENDFQYINMLNALLFVIGLISCIFSVITGVLLAHRIARPITKTAEIANQIARGDYKIRFEGDAKTEELSSLISSINDLADALDKQEKYRKQLTTDIAHELRTPLTAIRSHLEAMVEGLWEATPERLNGCLEEIKRLGNLISDLNRLSKLEEDDVKLNKSRVDLMEVVHTVSGNFEKEAHKKNIILSVLGASAFIYADKDRVSQVITNILSNAVKYTPDGGHIRIEVKGSEFDGIVSIQDDGIGISQKDIPFVFERFYRTDQSRSRKTGGAGIGLTIAKSIVEAHRGNISIESQENKGSRFTVTLPKGENNTR